MRLLVLLIALSACGSKQDVSEPVEQKEIVAAPQAPEPRPSAEASELQTWIAHLDELDVGDRRSIERAIIAADALGRAKHAEAELPLIKAAMLQVPKLSPAQRVRISAIRALGNYGHSKAAVNALIKILEVDRADQPLQLHAAAANALATTGSEAALQPLLLALYALPPIYFQLRGAITGIGEPAIDQLILIFEGKHVALNEYARQQGFATDCKRASGPSTQCKAPGNLRFKAAALLGDLHAKRAAPALVAYLKRPVEVAFFDPNTGSPGPSAHSAVLDALRKIGDPAAADPIFFFIKNKGSSDLVQPLAIDAYSMLATDTKALTHLGKNIQNRQQAEQVRRSSALAYGRLATQTVQLGVLQTVIDRYSKEAVKSAKRAKKAKNADKKRALEQAAEDYRGWAREFEQYKTRARVGIKCKADPTCLGAYLDKSADEIVDELQIPSGGEMSPATKQAYRIAAIDRALVELGKMGKRGRPVLPKLLVHVGSTERLVRQGILLALVRIAEVPCQKCVDRLTEVVESQKDQTTLDYLTADTKIVRNYFLRAGGAKR
jgi:hypothetical protein